MAMGIHKFSKRRGRGARAPMAEINVTPLVDVMLVLLVIFMVTAPLMKAGIPITLPDSRAKPLDQTPKQVTITMNAEGRVFLDDDELSPGELAERVGSLPRGADGAMPLVTLRADKALEYGRVVGVMGELNRAGITAISLVTVAGGAPAETAKKP
ncbi:biopolymer transporter ExbD [Novosphingobium sediminicola]|uniref:Biopolymer transport protein TolR n=1 Tax=Novosphingobium sediminicola TaxID=563162 RepID=A0A7W6CIA9_9SPHN|nr:biopolymer transporter ExbD [Novosphingobium sediminicola]MBB3953586.1 biopolymer transport protein TolR [Novosphingobium sediminicola]